MSHLSPVPSDPVELAAWLEQHAGDAAAVPWQNAFNPFSNAEIELPDPPRAVRELTVKVVLRGVKPPIWRRLVISGDTTLDALHGVLQVAMGWTDSHLHRFYPSAEDRGSYFITEYDLQESSGGTPEESVRVDQVLREPDDRICYEYDFGDGWTHDVRLESVGEVAGDPLPRCTGGAKACPPEDVGGIYGYQELAAWHRAGRPADTLPEQFDSVEHLVDWLPADFDPDAFDATEVDLMLRAAEDAQLLLDGLTPALAAVLSGLDPTGARLALQWVAAIPEEGPSNDDLTAAMQHWRVLLEAVGNGVKLTSAGYLPPSVVQQVYDALGLDQVWIGKGNREDLTPPIASLRASAQQLGLLRKAKGELAPTAKARAATTDAAALSRFVADRLPIGRHDVEQEAGWFALLGMAAGVHGSDLELAISRLLTSRGWRMPDGSPPDPVDIYRLTNPTITALTGPIGGLGRRGPAPWLRGVAAQVVTRR